MLGVALIDWVPSLNLFAFNDMEMGPSLEELARLTGLPLDYTQYFSPKTSPKTATPQNWFGIPYLVRPAASGQDAVVFSLDLLYDLFSGPQSTAGSTFARNALMFCLIAEVLFSGWRRSQTPLLFEVMSRAVRRQGIISLILAELFDGLTDCALGRTRVLRGCCAFLQVSFLHLFFSSCFARNYFALAELLLLSVTRYGYGSVFL